jgi:parallel beta-helix repeat protein
MYQFGYKDANTCAGCYAISSNNCPSTLTAGASCQVGVEFRPTGSGTKTANFTVYSTVAGGGGTVVSALTGVGSTTIYVNPSMNGTVGNSTSPFKTIKQATDIASSGMTIQLASGTYSTASNGETFPVNVPAGVSLIGDETSKGNGASPVFIAGPTGNTEAVSLGAGSTIAGVKTTSSSTFFAILISSVANATVRNNTVTSSTSGIDVYHATNPVITGNSVTSNTNQGVVLYSTSGAVVSGNNISSNGGIAIYSSGGSSGIVENNSLRSNGWGLQADSTTLDAGSGGGTGHSSGNNDFACNATNGVLVNGSSTSGTFSAENNLWDHNPPTSADITAASGNVTLDVANAHLATNPCP